MCLFLNLSTHSDKRLRITYLRTLKFVTYVISMSQYTRLVVSTKIIYIYIYKTCIIMYATRLQIVQLVWFFFQVSTCTRNLFGGTSRGMETRCGSSSLQRRFHLLSIMACWTCFSSMYVLLLNKMFLKKYLEKHLTNSVGFEQCINLMVDRQYRQRTNPSQKDGEFCCLMDHMRNTLNLDLYTLPRYLEWWKIIATRLLTQSELVLMGLRSMERTVTSLISLWKMGSMTVPTNMVAPLKTVADSYFRYQFFYTIF